MQSGLLCQLKAFRSSRWPSFINAAAIHLCAQVAPPGACWPAAVAAQWLSHWHCSESEPVVLMLTAWSILNIKILSQLNLPL